MPVPSCLSGLLCLLLKEQLPLIMSSLMAKASPAPSVASQDCFSVNSVQRWPRSLRFRLALLFRRTLLIASGCAYSDYCFNVPCFSVEYRRSVLRKKSHCKCFVFFSCLQASNFLHFLVFSLSRASGLGALLPVVNYFKWY